MREQRQELILRRVCANQFLPQRDVACLVLDEIKYTLNGLVRALQPEKVDV